MTSRESDKLADLYRNWASRMAADPTMSYFGRERMQPGSFRQSPNLADPTGLPPILIPVGGHEWFPDDIVCSCPRRRGRVSMELEVVPEMLCVFEFLDGVASGADAAIARAGTWRGQNWWANRHY